MEKTGINFWCISGSTTSSEGNYGFEGNLDNIPIAPDWLLAEMKSLKASEKKLVS